MSRLTDTFGARSTFASALGASVMYRLDALTRAGVCDLASLPFSIRVLLENALRNLDNFEVLEAAVRALAAWSPTMIPTEIPFKPARVLLQDFTGVPAVVDLAALRDAVRRIGGDPRRINPLFPVDLVIDHSVQVDAFGSSDALLINAQFEFERNQERYEFLHWGQKAFDNFRVVPPATGIVHQVNLEYLANVVQRYRDPLDPNTFVALPDTLVGTDSHTTMINGLGVVAWGVGGIEAEAAMLGQPIYMLMPEVIGLKLTGSLRDGATATDLVLMVTQMLRQKGVVGKFVEFYGPGLSRLSLPDRATIANMAPEYGATVGFFPVDEETVQYMLRTGRDAARADFVRRYCQEQGLWRTDDTPDPAFTDTLALDLDDVEPSLAGPKRPQDRVLLRDVKASFEQTLTAPISARGGYALAAEQVGTRVMVQDNGHSAEVGHGAVVIAAITSCTNTSNPSVMVAAGLLAKKAVAKGLARKPYVKTSLAPGSRVVTEYLDNAGLTAPLEALGFHTVGYGCTTCIGNSGPLPDAVAAAVQEGDLVATAVLSGNRNFEGRISPMVKANYLASPPLVVAYALAGTVDINFDTEPLGHALDGTPVYLRDVWPSQAEILGVVQSALSPALFQEQYGNVYTGNPMWNDIPSPDDDVFHWDEASTYIKEPPFFMDLSPVAAPIAPLTGARVLALLGDSVTTDHISPAGSISKDSPAGQYLLERGVPRQDFNTYGARRGNHEIMMRGTFANIRLRNQLLPGSEGGVTMYLPTGEAMSIYDASMRYQADGTALVVLAGADYGMGSSRDWAAKGVQLLGVRAVIARSFERIHRSNLVMMGVLPLQFQAGEGWAELGLTGHETFALPGLDDDLTPGQLVEVVATATNGEDTRFTATVRVDTPVEVGYYRNGGILQAVLRNMLAH